LPRSHAYEQFKVGPFAERIKSGQSSSRRRSLVTPGPVDDAFLDGMKAVD